MQFVFFIRRIQQHIFFTDYYKRIQRSKGVLCPGVSLFEIHRYVPQNMYIWPSLLHLARRFRVIVRYHVLRRHLESGLNSQCINGFRGVSFLNLPQQFLSLVSVSEGFSTFSVSLQHPCTCLVAKVWYLM